MKKITDFIKKQLAAGDTRQQLRMNVFNLDFVIAYNDDRLMKEMETEYSYFVEFNNPAQKCENPINIKVVTLDIPEEISAELSAGEPVKLHSSESKQLKYYTDGRVLNNEDALRSAFKTVTDLYTCFLCKKTGNVIAFDRQNRDIIIAGRSRQWVELKDIIETCSISFLELNNHLMVHSSCTTDEAGDGYLIIGHSGKGKTSLMLEFIFHAGHQFVSNDRIYIHAAPGTPLTIHGAPIQLNIGLGNFKSMPYLEKYIPEKLQAVYRGSDIKLINENKVRFDCCQFPDLFREQVKLKAELKYICVPQLELKNKSYSKNLSMEEGLALLEKNLLSPLDENHPKWLGYFPVTDDWIQKNIQALFTKIRNNHIRIMEWGIGYDAKAFFSGKNW